jgi:dephospho-CoA kinase
MITVGVTGGIASGKTLVCRTFRRLGAYLIDADERGHQVLREHKIISALIDYFGREMLDGNGNIDRARLAELAFASKEALQKLNEITHPTIEARIREKLERLERSGYPGVVVIDAAVLGEWELVKELTHVVFVDSPQWHRLKRLIDERKLDQKEAERRIKAQEEMLEKVSPYVTIVIKNTGEPDELRAKVMIAWRKICAREET